MAMLTSSSGNHILKICCIFLSIPRSAIINKLIHIQIHFFIPINSPQRRQYHLTIKRQQWLSFSEQQIHFHLFQKKKKEEEEVVVVVVVVVVAVVVVFLKSIAKNFHLSQYCWGSILLRIYLKCFPQEQHARPSAALLVERQRVK